MHLESRIGLILTTWLALTAAAIPAALADGVDEDAMVERVIRPDVVYGHKDGLAMTLDVFAPAAEPNGAGLLYMVSGGWYSRWAPPADWLPYFQPFLDAGYTVFAVRHGSSPRYSIPEAMADVTRSVRFVRANAAEFGVDPARLAAMGNSAGGHLALVLGTQGDDGLESDDPVAQVSSRVQAVVALVAPTDLTIAVWDAPESQPEYRRFPALDLAMDKAEVASPLFDVTPDDAPSLLVMGGADDLVPLLHGERMAAAFDREDVAHELVVIEDAGHGLGGAENWPTVSSMAIDWLDRHLAPTAGSDRAAE